MSRGRAPVARPKPRARMRMPVPDALLAVPAIAVTAFFVVVALLSLGWPVEHDTMCMGYAGFVFGHLHRIPYRDLFDPNLPGTYLVYTILDTVFGPKDIWFRVADLILFGALTWVTWKWLRSFGWKTAIVGPALFGFFYFQDGPTMCLQREYLMLPLFALAILFTLRLQRLGPGRRALGLGLCVGLSALIKPQAVLVLLPCLGFLLTERADDAPTAAPVVEPSRWLSVLGLGAVGAALPIGLTVAWLAAVGALRPFLDMARNYYPLYAHLNGIHQTVNDEERRQYVMDGARLMGGLRLWLIPAALGAWVGAHRGAPAAHRRLVWLLVSLAVISWMFPVITGQFFRYHWIPFYFFLAMLSSLCLATPTPKLSPRLRAAAALGLVVVALMRMDPPNEIDWQLAGLPISRNLGPRVDALTEYLRTHLRPGDTVQPLDWTGGGIAACWRARAPIATSFMADFYLYHHVSSPYIQSLRRRFMREMRQTRPRIVIEILTLKPWVSGLDTTHEFPELREFLHDDYRPDVVNSAYVIYVRRDG